MLDELAQANHQWKDQRASSSRQQIVWVPASDVSALLLYLCQQSVWAACQGREKVGALEVFLTLSQDYQALSHQFRYQK